MKKINSLTIVALILTLVATSYSQCTSNDDCGFPWGGYNDYCKKPVGQCGGQGVCTSKPQGCLTLWAPVCGCDGQTYSNECFAAMVGVNVKYPGECQPVGPTVIMTEPKTIDENVHTGQSDISCLKLLWTEDIIFDANNITVHDQNDNPVGFSALGNMTQIMTINFDQTLFHDKYTITINDSVVSADTGYPIDGDNYGGSGGDAVIIIQHRSRADFDNNNIINFGDFAQLAQDWLMAF